MKHINIDEKWSFRRAFIDSLGMLDSIPAEIVNLPHDAMIGTKVTPDAIAGVDSGFFNGTTCSYVKYVFIPAEWKDECIMLNFDGAMMHVTVDVNGCKCGEHHYGYSPFTVDITDRVTFGEENRITINANSGIQPSSRWYTGCGLFRGIELVHSPKIFIPTDGVFLRTKEIAEVTKESCGKTNDAGGKKKVAFIEADVDVSNRSLGNHLVEVTVELFEKNSDCRADGDDCYANSDCSPNNADGSANSSCRAKAKRVIQINKQCDETAHISIQLEEPKLWDADTPNLYRVKVTAKDKGVYRTHFIETADGSADEEETVFGVRTITADSARGLCINGKTVKLKGGCVHHDNGLLGSISLFQTELRKVKKLKSAGFNAIRTAHNPPSSALVKACDEAGMYIFDEAFDAWGIAKRAGDYSQYFSKCWKEDLTAFVKRDRIHPSVIIWSIGNEIPERGGLNNGYTISAQLAQTVHSLDQSRPVSNGICSFWSGLDDYYADGKNQSQNAKDEGSIDFWEKGTEPFTNGLDIVGYNYMEDLYERDHELFPERVILGSENFPKEIGFRWPFIEKLPYVIGDFTWTCWDYIGEAGIGKALYVEKDDPLAGKKPWEIMPQQTSHFPYRLANDADFDITGRLLAQGAYRSVVWGSNKTHLYSFSPSQFGKVECMSMWGFPDVSKNWNYQDSAGKQVELLVFSNADEVELFVNGKSVSKKAVCKEKPYPNSVRFETVYEEGKVEAVSYKNGIEVSRDFIESSGKPCKIVLVPEKTQMSADGHDVVYVSVDVLDENDKPVTDAEVILSAAVDGEGVLAGFGTGRPVTEEIYSDYNTITFGGHATAVLRSGYEKGVVHLKVSASGLNDASVEINCR